MGTAHRRGRGRAAPPLARRRTRVWLVDFVIQGMGLRSGYRGVWHARWPDPCGSGSSYRPSRSGRSSGYCGTTATASISTKKSGWARAETNTPVIAGGLGVWGQAFWNAAKPACSGCPSTTTTLVIDAFFFCTSASSTLPEPAVVLLASGGRTIAALLLF